MRWCNIQESYNELFPHEIINDKVILETPTGTKEEHEEEIIHETIVEEKPKEQEESEKDEDGND